MPYYDQLGLLSPLSRTEGGHRCYTGDDVRRLHRIVALRSLGISLEEIGTLLDSEPDPVSLLRRHIDVLDERVRMAITVRARLLDVLASRAMNAEPSVSQLLQLVEETVAMSEPNTPEQFSSLVLFTGRLEEARAFYRAVGLSLHDEDHGSGFLHYATDPEPSSHEQGGLVHLGAATALRQQRPERLAVHRGGLVQGGQGQGHPRAPDVGPCGHPTPPRPRG
jgi:DNA-binding transcriptional MerR regulator